MSEHRLKIAQISTVQNVLSYRIMITGTECFIPIKSNRIGSTVFAGYTGTV